MYAVIESGGKQHKVVEGEVLRLEKLEAAAGDKVSFDKVLMVAEGDKVTIGEPYVTGGNVTAEVVEQGRGDKVTIIKFHRRKHHRKQAGHRQSFTEVKITDISVKKPRKKAEPKPETEVAAAEE
jgi:large subunit ribosomal protein L21